MKHIKNKNLSHHEKLEIVKSRSQALEMKAKYFEAGENGSRLGHQESSNMYLDSIKVKMALLEQM